MPPSWVATGRVPAASFCHHYLATPSSAWGAHARAYSIKYLNRLAQHARLLGQRSTQRTPCHALPQTPSTGQQRRVARGCEAARQRLRPQSGYAEAEEPAMLQTTAGTARAHATDLLWVAIVSAVGDELAEPREAGAGVLLLARREDRVAALVVAGWVGLKVDVAVDARRPAATQHPKSVSKLCSHTPDEEGPEMVIRSGLPGVHMSVAGTARVCWGTMLVRRVGQRCLQTPFRKGGHNHRVTGRRRLRWASSATCGLPSATRQRNMNWVAPGGQYSSDLEEFSAK